MTPRRRRLWQRRSPIARSRSSSDDESPSGSNDDDESNESDESVEPDFVSAWLTTQQNTNISGVPSAVEEDTTIQSVESPQQEDTITASTESPEQEASIVESIERDDNSIESIESHEPSPTFTSLHHSATDTPPEETTSPSPPHPIKSESSIDVIMADIPLAPKAEPLSDVSSRNGSPHPTPGASSEPLSSEDGVTDRCYGFLLLHYPESLPAAIDTISVLLIYQRRPYGLPPYWGFPKGHPEPEDSSEWESASRELLEETGLNPERVKPITPSGFSPPLPDSVVGLSPDFMSIISQYPSSGGGIKEVTYFLARVTELEKLSEQVEELVECRWVTLKEAAELIDAKPVRRVLHKLIGLVSSSQGTLSESDYLKDIRWKEVDSSDENGLPRQWRTVGFCTPE